MSPDDSPPNRGNTALVIGIAVLLMAGLMAAAILVPAPGVRHYGPPPIVIGTECAYCGMRVADLRFACLRQHRRTLRVYDAIECLLRDPEDDGRAYLADHSTARLHAADSLWVVKGEIPSPMGEGYAAFLDRAVADRVAVQTRGKVDRVSEFAKSYAHLRR